MKSTVFVKAAAFLLLFGGLTAGASAQIIISGGFALSQLDTSGSDLDYFGGGLGYGGNIYADYILPINIPLSLGVEAGGDTAKLDAAYNDTILAVPVLARVAYHFDIMPKLDLYVVGKIGICFVLWQGEQLDWLKDTQGYTVKTPPGLGFGFDVGVAYYFTSTLGAFAEAGFDRYNFSTTISGNGEPARKLKSPFNRFLTVGISVRF
ncbi:MAG: outer membrane beta-barrel protein [Treponema sp.]|nr:outer membrane beta-barrel protein [Treponema sp.]